MNPTQSQPAALPKHTPTPYYADGIIIRETETDIAICAVGISNSRKHSEHLANAAFVVEACNSHPALVAENKRLREALEDLLTLSECRLASQWKNYEGETNHPIMQARAALAKEDV